MITHHKLGIVSKTSLPLELDSDNSSLLVHFNASSGTYHLTIEADARKFEWEKLYFALNLFGNANQRTGPWDFNLLDNNKPLLPAYWISLNGKKIGLWYFNRPSADQIHKKRFKGELGFQILESGEHKLQFEPYQPFTLDWDNLQLEREQEDNNSPKMICSDPFARIFPDTMPQNKFTDGFLDSIEWSKSEFDFDRWGVGGLQLPIQIAAWHWLRDNNALQKAKSAIERYLSMPAWGNSNEDGYGHNGDMGAAKLLCGMAISLRWLPNELEPLRNRLIEKIRVQGNLFFEQMLLHRGYWGGAVLQDHGYQSLAWFATAAYVCKGNLDNCADKWLMLALPRIWHTLAAMPTDGVVPATNYHTLGNYVDILVVFRELHLIATGIDIYKNDCICSIPRTARTLCVSEIEADASLPDLAGFAHYEKGFGLLAHPSPLGDLMPYDGAIGFFAQLSNNSDAQWLIEQIISRHNERSGKLYPFYEAHFKKNWIWAMLFFTEQQAKSAVTKDASEEFSVNLFKDSGVAAMRFRQSLVVAKCGVPTSLTSYRNTSNCTDRMCFAPLGGNFVFIHNGRKIFHGVNSRYRIRTLHGNVLLVDGCGQRGDVGMPISQPDAPYNGEKLLGVIDNRAVEMDLTTAYDDLLYYNRVIGHDDNGKFYLQDRVMSDKPRRLTWIFNTYKRNQWKMIDNGIWELTVDGYCYRIETRVEEHDFTTNVRETPAVWSFDGNDIESCNHLAIEPVKPVTNASLSLRVIPKQIVWSKGSL